MLSAMRTILHRTFTDAHKGRAGHINIQHYAQLIGDACDLLTKRKDIDENKPLRVKEERVRFLAELHPGDLAEASVEIVSLAGSNLIVEGDVRRESDDKIACKFTRHLAHLDALFADAPADQPMPPGLGSYSDISAIEAEFEGSTLSEYRANIELADSDNNESISPRALWHLITEALWATQHQMGVTQSSMNLRDIAGGATVFQLRHRRPIPVGTELSVSSSIIGLGKSSIRMKHEIQDANSDKELFLVVHYVLTFFHRKSGDRFPIAEVFPNQSILR